MNKKCLQGACDIQQVTKERSKILCVRAGQSVNFLGDSCTTNGFINFPYNKIQIAIVTSSLLKYSWIRIVLINWLLSRDDSWRRTPSKTVFSMKYLKFLKKFFFILWLIFDGCCEHFATQTVLIKKEALTMKLVREEC